MNQRTEAPTPERLRTARRRGQVPKSQVLASSIQLWAVPAMASLGLSAFCEPALRTMAMTLSSPEHFSGAIACISWGSVWVGCLVILAGGVSVFAHGIQTGPVFAPAAVSIDWSRLSPVHGAKRLFSCDPWVELLRNVIHMALGLGAATWAANTTLAEVLGAGTVAGDAHLERAVLGASRVLVSAAASIGAVSILISAGDVAWARFAHRRRLKMSRDEVRREHRNREGDPHLKRQRRQRARELALLGGMEALRSARAVVVNPSHLAVALRFVPDEDHAPTVTAKGVGAHARRIRQAADRIGIPVVEHVTLARSLHRVELEEPIPEALFAPVAELLVHLDTRARRSRSAPAPASSNRAQEPPASARG
ncbi:MAG: flagellar biosynthesis protein FlhB [Myxococcota bacterium]